MPWEPRCPGGCHDGETADYEHYCDSAGVEYGPASWAAWLHALDGWDGDVREVRE